MCTHRRQTTPTSRVEVPAPAAAPAVRACMISFYFEPHYSGSAIQCRALSRYLKRRGVGVQIVSANTD